MSSQYIPIVSLTNLSQWKVILQEKWEFEIDWKRAFDISIES